MKSGLRDLEPYWNGPHTVVLTTPTAVKVDGVQTGIHPSQVKPAGQETTQQLRLHLKLIPDNASSEKMDGNSSPHRPTEAATPVFPILLTYCLAVATFSTPSHLDHHQC